MELKKYFCNDCGKIVYRLSYNKKQICYDCTIKKLREWRRRILLNKIEKLGNDNVQEI